MGNLRQRIEEEIQVREVEVHDGDDVFLLRGLPDAETLAAVTFISEPALIQKAKHWTSVLRQDGKIRAQDAISPEIVREVVMVTRAIQAPDGEQPYDEVEIAALSKKDGVLFMKLLQGAMEIFGLVSQEKDPDHSVLDEVSPGNSPVPEDGGSNSNSTGGSPPAATRRRKGS